MKNVIITDKLNYALFNSIVNEDNLLICIKDYCIQTVREQLAEWVIQHQNLHVCPHEIRTGDEIKYLDYGVDSIAESYNTTYGESAKSEKFKKYYNLAKTYHSSLRNACSPYLNPFDKFRLELDELWPHKVGLGNFDKNGKQIAGIARVVRAGEDVLVSKQPHVDSMPKQKVNLIQQLSVNIYLDLPQKGGELEIWSVPCFEANTIETMDPATDLRSILPQPSIFNPTKGDLVIFNTRKPHAVRSFLEGRRITLQSFIGIHDDYTISLWA